MGMSSRSAISAISVALVMFCTSACNAVEIPKPVINIPRPSIPRPTINVPRPNVTVNVPKPVVNVPKVSVPNVDVHKAVVNLPKVNVPKAVVNVPKAEVHKPVVSPAKVDSPKTAVTMPIGIPTSGANTPKLDVSKPKSAGLPKSNAPGGQVATGDTKRLIDNGPAGKSQVVPTTSSNGNVTQVQLPNGTFGKAALNPDGTITVSNNNGSVILTKQQMAQVATGDMTALKPLMSKSQSVSTPNSKSMKAASTTANENSGGGATAFNDAVYCKSHDCSGSSNSNSSGGGTAIAPKNSAGGNSGAGKSSPQNQQNGPPDWTSIPDGTPLKAGTKFSDGSTIGGDCIKMGAGCYLAGSPNLANLANSGSSSLSGTSGGLSSMQPSASMPVSGNSASIGSFVSRILQSAIVGDSAAAAEAGGLQFPLQVPCPGGGGLCSQSCTPDTCYIVDPSGKATAVPNTYGQRQGQGGQGQGGQDQAGLGQGGQGQGGQNQGGQDQAGLGQGGQGQAGQNQGGQDQAGLGQGGQGQGGQSQGGQDQAGLGQGGQGQGGQSQGGQDQAGLGQGGQGQGGQSQGGQDQAGLGQGGQGQGGQSQGGQDQAGLGQGGQGQGGQGQGGQGQAGLGQGGQGQGGQGQGGQGQAGLGQGGQGQGGQGQAGLGQGGQGQGGQGQGGVDQSDFPMATVVDASGNPVNASGSIGDGKSLVLSIHNGSSTLNPDGSTDVYTKQSDGWHQTHYAPDATTGTDQRVGFGANSDPKNPGQYVYSIKPDGTAGAPTYLPNNGFPKSGDKPYRGGP
ncbi:hypothetical protein ABIE91_003568 [Bradyrhizobium elkanii]